MKFGPLALAGSAFLAAAISWLLVTQGGDRRADTVKPEDRACTRNAECRLVEVPCTCGQLNLAVNVQNYKKYERNAACTGAEIAHCARVGASVPQSAICRVGVCKAEPSNAKPGAPGP